MAHFNENDSYMTPNLYIAIIAKQKERTINKPANLHELIHPVYTVTSENGQIGIVQYNSQNGKWIRISDGCHYPISNRKTNGQDVIIDGSLTKIFESKWLDEIIKYIQENNSNDGFSMSKSQLIELERFLQKLFEDERAGENTEESIIPSDCLRQKTATSENVGEGAKTDTSEDDRKNTKNGSGKESEEEDERQ